MYYVTTLHTYINTFMASQSHLISDSGQFPRYCIPCVANVYIIYLYIYLFFHSFIHLFIDMCLFMICVVRPGDTQ